ncbi:FACT complex subunit SPT16 isoform X1 [Lates japonicus]|uniref:FACT complex subunit SPT16 isoform X1 n=1 Tax=Lates japonicus TaxID=270547 RepID=A0AAD3N490_LATJO|nr:FACT complex subunit SPT16 isoform X1 [Lates japonicus]
MFVEGSHTGVQFYKRSGRSHHRLGQAQHIRDRGSLSRADGAGDEAQAQVGQNFMRRFQGAPYRNCLLHNRPFPLFNVTEWVSENRVLILKIKRVSDFSVNIFLSHVAAFVVTWAVELVHFGQRAVPEELDVVIVYKDYNRRSP